MRKKQASSKAAKKGNTSFGEELIQSMQEALAHARGELVLPVREYHPPRHIDVAPVRKKLGLSQGLFARAFGLNVATIRDWEQGRREPEGAARILLAIIAKHPAIVREVLSEVQG